MGYGLINAFAAVTAASCTTTYFNNQTVTTNTNVAGCSVIAQNITVNSGASLTLAGSQYVLINYPFIVNSGSQFTMSSP